MRRNLVQILGDASLLAKTKVVAIGPVTAETCKELGVGVAAMPEEYTIDALTAAVARLALEDAK